MPFGKLSVVDLRWPAWEELNALRGRDGLHLVNLNAADVPRLASMGFSKLRSLILRDLHTRNLGFLERFSDLENLQVWQSKDVTSLDGIQTLRKLDWLSLSELGPLSSLRPLSTLDGLKELFLSGGVWKDQKILGDFLPLAELRSLRQLSITNVRGPVDFTPLLDFDRLESLNVATAKFPVSEMARLAAKYPFWHQQRPWLQPLQDDPTGCSRCGKARTILLLQRKKAIWCEHCESVRLGRLLSEFENLIRSYRIGYS